MIQVVSSKQALRDLKHGAAFGLGTDLGTEKADEAVPSNMDELLDVSDDDDNQDGISSIQSHFGAQQLPGTPAWCCCVLSRHTVL